MKHQVQIIQTVDVQAGDRFVSTRTGRMTEIVKLVSVPMEDGGYTSLNCRWILVSEGRCATTWDSKFHDTPQDALGNGQWRKA
jgi:hypothetical protein